MAGTTRMVLNLRDDISHRPGGRYLVLHFLCSQLPVGGVKPAITTTRWTATINNYVNDIGAAGQERIPGDRVLEIHLLGPRPGIAGMVEQEQLEEYSYLLELKIEIYMYCQMFWLPSRGFVHWLMVSRSSQEKLVTLHLRCHENFAQLTFIFKCGMDEIQNHARIPLRKTCYTTAKKAHAQAITSWMEPAGAVVQGLFEVIFLRVHLPGCSKG